MSKRFVSIWFPHLKTDWFTLRQPELKNIPFVLRAPFHGRMMITAANICAEQNSIHAGMVLADARAILPDLEVADDIGDLEIRLLKKLATWCIRFTPFTCVDLPDGILLDASGCAHLWGGEINYINDITKKLNDRGYDVNIAMSDTIGLSWGLARYAGGSLVVKSEDHIDCLMNLPPEALRVDESSIERLHKLGLHKVGQFIRIPRKSLRRRFGKEFISQLDKAIGSEIEVIEPIHPPEPFSERLPCMEPIVTAIGIEIALKELLEKLCLRLQQDQKGIRNVILRCFRVDGKTEEVSIATSRPSHHVDHLFKLLSVKLSGIEPALGIELFALDATKVEEHLPEQSGMWGVSADHVDTQVSELIDRLANRVGMNSFKRYLPSEHYWPERSVRTATNLHEEKTIEWPIDKRRPVHLLAVPEKIEVTAPIPDYPPMLFRLKGKVHQVVKADGPERIEQEWWIQRGQHRDYYCVEDESGCRYWLFRLGHYHDKTYQWFLHGYFA